MNGFPYLANLVREVQLIEHKTRREAEREAALAADSKEYNISPESKAALARGDRQRAMGVYEKVEHTHECNTREDDICETRGFCTCECGKRRFWQGEKVNQFVAGGRWIA